MTERGAHAVATGHDYADAVSALRLLRRGLVAQLAATLLGVFVAASMTSGVGRIYAVIVLALAAIATGHLILGTVRIARLRDVFGAAPGCWLAVLALLVALAGRFGLTAEMLRLMEVLGSADVSLTRMATSSQSIWQLRALVATLSLFHAAALAAVMWSAARTHGAVRATSAARRALALTLAVPAVIALVVFLGWSPAEGASVVIGVAMLAGIFAMVVSWFATLRELTATFGALADRVGTVPRAVVR